MGFTRETCCYNERASRTRVHARTSRNRRTTTHQVVGCCNELSIVTARYCCVRRAHVHLGAIAIHAASVVSCMHQSMHMSRDIAERKRLTKAISSPSAAASTLTAGSRHGIQREVLRMTTAAAGNR